jgi:adenylate cyclase
MQDSRIERRLAAVLAADVVGYSHLMELDEEGTMSELRRHRKEFLEPTVAKHKGRIFKLMGDGALAEFGSVVDAVRCALDIQRGMAERTAGSPDGRRIMFRLGLNLGDLIVEGEDFYGEGVNIAARLEGLAPPGGIACSAVVRNQVGNKLDIAFVDQGEKNVKNIDQPVHVFFVDLAGPLAQPVEQEASSMKTDKPSVAVLPFTNMSGDPEQEYFADGITEDIITDLSKVSGLFVLGRNTVFTLKGKAVNLEQVAKQLGVAYVLEGSVRKAGNRVRINAQLIHGTTGGHLWADRFDRDLTDIFAIQDEITHKIVDELRVALLPEERKALAQQTTDNVEAYTSYLKGREFFHRSSRSSLSIAKQMFSKAIALDPLYARAYAGIADCDSFLFLQYDEAVSVVDILANCSKALELDGELAEARASRGLALSVNADYAEAEKEFRRAIEIDPNLFEARYFFARSCYAQGKLAEAAEQYEIAARLKPDDFQAASMLRQVYNALGDHAKEMEAARTSIARAELALAANPENARAAYLGAISLAMIGEMERSQEWAARAIAINPDDILTKYNIACLYCFLGKFDEAIDLLIEIIPRANHETKAWIVQDTDFVPLHGLPGWQTVLKSLDT